MYISTIISFLLEHGYKLNKRNVCQEINSTQWGNRPLEIFRQIFLMTEKQLSYLQSENGSVEMSSLHKSLLCCVNKRKYSTDVPSDMFYGILSF